MDNLTSLKKIILYVFGIPLFLVSTVMSQGAGSALDFDGDNDYISVVSASGDELNPSSTLTVECWVYFQEAFGSAHRPHLITKTSSYGLVVETSGVVRLYIFDTSYKSVQSTTVLVINRWYHIAAVYDDVNNDLKIFINGNEENNNTTDYGPLAANANEVRLGTIIGGSNTYTNGIMDEIRIWNTARSEADIQSAMCEKLNGDEAGLVGYWRLDDASGTTATDQTSYGNNGTLTNFDASPDWVTSSASVGDASLFAESVDISETAGCPLDVVFGTGGEEPGSGVSLTVMQVNEYPNALLDLLTHYPQTYWEIWSEDTDFDGDFTASVQFHYDEVGGIGDEANLQLYRRDSATTTSWTPLVLNTDYSIVSDDGGSSTNTDGIGYVELIIDESTVGDFSGQYILTSDDSDNSLPVELCSFSATSGNGWIELSWETASETDNQGFIILRSAGEKDHFTQIDTYEQNKNLKGAGTTSHSTAYRYKDSCLVNGETYYYKLVEIDFSGVQTEHKLIVSGIPQPYDLEMISSELPRDFNLKQNFPNPFNPLTIIGFDIPEGSTEHPSVSVTIFNLLGERIKQLYSGPISPGKYQLEWSGSDDNDINVPSGIYIYQVIYNDHYCASKKMMLLR